VELFPAIDLLGGRCVRLTQGDYERSRTYDADPVETAKAFAAAGAPWLHVVDLDAARSGIPANRQVIAAIAAAVSIPVQASGGLRDADAVAAVLDLGVSRVVIGTAVVTDPAVLEKAVAHHPGRVAVGLDHRRVGERREIALRGWQEPSGVTLTDALAQVADSGAAAVIVTDIDRDGMLEGPDVEGMAEVLEVSRVPVVASGGVSSVEDLRRLASVAVGKKQLAGVIVGKALHEGRMTVAEAVAACGR
jgi:phosphoribosylformimino-5-aminoimidazole carboxamide ribotide isomerase